MLTIISVSINIMNTSTLIIDVYLAYSLELAQRPRQWGLQSTGDLKSQG